MTDPHANQAGQGLPTHEAPVEIWPLFRAPGDDALDATLASIRPPDGLVLVLETALMVGDQFVLRHTGDAGRAVWFCTVTRSTRLPGGTFRLEARGACVVRDQDVERTPANELLARATGTLLEHLECRA